MRRGLAGLAIVVALAGPPASRAYAGPPPAATNEEQRTALFKEGHALAEAGRYAEAAEKFRAVIAIRSAPKALIALAVVEELLLHLVEAKKGYERALADATAERVSEDAETARRAIAAITPKVPRIRVRLPAGVDHASVVIDGSLSQSGVDIEVNPGVHTVVVTSPGHAEIETSLRLGEGERRDVEPSLPEITQPLPDTTPRPRPRPGPTGASGPPTAAIVIGAIGISAAAVGLALWGVGKGKENDVSTHCPGGGTDSCPPSLKSDVQTAHDTIVAGNVLVGAGIGLVAIGGIGWAISAFQPPEPAKPPNRSGVSKLSIVPAPRGASIVFRSVF